VLRLADPLEAAKNRDKLLQENAPKDEEGEDKPKEEDDEVPAEEEEQDDAWVEEEDEMGNDDYGENYFDNGEGEDDDIDGDGGGEY